jgi:hypothetical protein
MWIASDASSLLAVHYAPGTLMRRVFEIDVLACPGVAGGCWCYRASRLVPARTRVVELAYPQEPPNP